MNCGGCSYGGCDDGGDEVQVLVIRTQVIRILVIDESLESLGREYCQEENEKQETKKMKMS